MSTALSASSPAALGSSDATCHASLESDPPVSQTFIRSTPIVSSQVPSPESLSARLSAPVSPSLSVSAPQSQTVISSFATPSIGSASSGRVTPSVPAPPASRSAGSQSPNPLPEVPSSQLSVSSSSRVSGTFSSVAASRSGSSIARSTLSSIRTVSNLQAPPTTLSNSTRSQSNLLVSNSITQEPPHRAATPSEKPAPSDPVSNNTPASSQGTHPPDTIASTQGSSASSAVMPSVPSDVKTSETPSKSPVSPPASHSTSPASDPVKNHGASPPPPPPSSKSSEITAPTQKSSPSPSKNTQPSPPPTQVHAPPPQTHQSAPPSSPTPSQPSAPSPPQRSPQQANGQSPTQTSTVIVPPESTFSKPVVVSTTDSHGQSTVSIPPLITSLAVSTEPDGSLITVTHVIANPTGIWSISDNADASSHGFFSNTGAVAGVFLVVGIVVTAIAATIAFVLCKRRRRRAIRTSISRPLPYPDNPFEDPRDSPSPTQMRYAASDSSHRNLVGGGIGLNSEPPVLPTQSYTVYETPAPTVGPSLHAQQTLAGVGAGNRTFDGLGFDPYREANPIRQSRPSYGSIGVAITSDDYEDLPLPLMSHAKHASLTPSTPSIYPATLPEDDDDRVVEPPVIMEPVPVPAASTLTRAPSTGPPIPPRSPLRNASADLRSKLLLRTQFTSQDQDTRGAKTYEPLTPPATASSASSHSPSSSVAPADPFADQTETIPHDNYFTRRKLYNTEQRPTSNVEWRP